MIYQLNKAIVSQYLSSLDSINLRGICPTLHNGIAKQSNPEPYITFDNNPGFSLRTICPIDIDVCVVEFRCYAKEALRVLDICSKLKAFYENRFLPLDDGYRIIKIKTLSIHKSFDPLQKIYVGTLQIEYTVQE